MASVFSDAIFKINIDLLCDLLKHIHKFKCTDIFVLPGDFFRFTSLNTVQ